MTGMPFNFVHIFIKKECSPAMLQLIAASASRQIGFTAFWPIRKSSETIEK